jgi:acetoacetyl-CoA reductase/3-oxoacyl-[acyl-carrier protein] reductase
MRAENFGRIINLSSVVAQTFVPGTSAYAASKSGLWGLTKSVASENAQKGITINNLNLGYFEIGMIQEVPKEYLDQIKSKIPSGELGHPYNIKETIKLLMKSDYINGTSIDINGGLF